MEQLLLQKLHRNLAQLSDSPSLLRSLSTARSLLAHPYSSDSTRRVVLDAVVGLLDRHRDGDPLVLRHALNLLAGIDSLHRLIPPSLLPLLKSFATTGKHLAADAVALLVSLAKGGGSASLVSSVVDENLVISLASSRFVSVRARLLDLLVLILGGATRDCVIVRSQVMVELLLGLADDLYPSIRKSAIAVLVSLLCEEVASVGGYEMLLCCYDRAVELLDDEDELVRVAAVRLVSECGRIFVMNKEELDNGERMDKIFVQLCSVARDMSMKVRVEAFVALGKVKRASESVLLQSLSKKVVSDRNGKKPLGDSSQIEYKFSLSRAAGAFVHGIEDEFYEVRAVSCKSLGLLTVFSVQFADNALDLLIDMLNDDSAVVRLQTLQALFHMATYNHLRLQERHMHMFLGSLSDTNASNRHAAREVLRVMKLHNLDMFKSSVDAITEILDVYPEEEGDIFRALSCMGRNHGKLAIKLARELPQEGVLASVGELTLGSSRAAALLVLAVSSIATHEKLIKDAPAAIFGYAIAMFGRISSSLQAVMDQDTLLAFLFHRSHMLSSVTPLQFNGDEHLQHKAGVIFEDAKHGDQSSSSPLLSCYASSQIKQNDYSLSIRPKSPTSTPLELSQRKGTSLDDEPSKPVNLILKRVVETWPMVVSQYTCGAKATLSACKDEVEMIAQNANEPGNASLAFALHYIQAIHLFAEIWGQLLGRIPCGGLKSIDLLLDKLDQCLRRMRYGFRRVGKKVECCILELMLLHCVLRLSKTGICLHFVLEKLQILITDLGLLCEEGSSHISDFSKQLKRLCDEGRATNCSHPFPVHDLIALFTLEQITITGQLEYVNAEMQAIGNDSENPLIFISGLPVGIIFQIMLFDVSNNDRFWLQIFVGESVQYVFLDLNNFVSCGKARKCIMNVPFYRTPNAASFSLRARIVMECCIEDGIDLKEVQAGPKCETALLCDEKEIYLVSNENKR